jgi:hypothetical protein
VISSAAILGTMRVAAFAAVSVIFGINLAETMRPLLPLWNGPEDFVALAEERFRPLREVLPKSGEVGYTGDHTTPDWLSDPEAVKRYYAAQYALAPLVVNRSSTPQIVVGDFAGTIRVNVPEGSMMEDFGGGIVVIRPATP